MLLLIIISSFVTVCQASRILVVFSVPEKSHNVLADSLVESLLDADYEVTYVTPYPKQQGPNLTYVDVSSVLDGIQDQRHMNEGEWPEDNTSPRFLPLLGTRFAQRVLNHPYMKELMMNTTIEFDSVLVEWFYTGLLAPLAAVFECPLIWYTPSDISWQSLSLVANPPAHRLDLPPTSLVDRIHHMWSQTYLTGWNYLYVSRIEIPAYKNIYGETFKVRRRFLPNYESLVNDCYLLLLNSHPMLGPAVSLPGNVKYIGGHHISKDVAPLPKNLKKLIDTSAAGVIYVNLGLNSINIKIADQITRVLKEVFSDVEETVIWRSDDIIVDLPRNVYTVKYPPQKSILNHVNTLAFVNHGDMLSLLDATHYGVPVIVVPLLEDQEANVNMMVKRGCGVRLDAMNLAWEVKKSLKSIKSNSSYLINAKKIKSTIRHQLVSPQQEFIHWIEVVTRTPSSTHLRSFTVHTSTLENYNVDIILLVLMVFWFLTKVAKVVKVHLGTAIVDHDKQE